jgi:ABC-type transport system involved in multi-copper enzyme maturation permease subunit
MMQCLRDWFSFPLLLKELTEAAAQRRTYIIRIIYAVLLYAIVGFEDDARRYWSDPQTVLGEGWTLLRKLTVLQFAGIFLCMPAFMAAAITSEKERGSLALLLLTPMTPGQIVAQKYLGGLMLMTSFLLLGLPLLGVCYAFGGIEPILLFGSAFVLFVAMLQCGAIALFCSAWCRTTGGAFICTYVLAAGLYAAPTTLAHLLDMFSSTFGGDSRIAAALEYAGGVAPLASLWPFWFSLVRRPSNLQVASELLVATLPAIASVIVFLVLARIHVVARAFTSPSKRLLTWFRQLDTSFVRANRFIGNVVFRLGDADLPEDRPIAWREMAQKKIGRLNYLFRLLVLIEVPVLVALYGITHDFDDDALSAITATVAVFAVLLVCAHGANAFVAERTNQTLDVLLTTPLTASQIVEEKAQVLRRFSCVAAVPLATVFACRIWLQASGMFTFEDSQRWAFLYALCAGLSLLVYLPLVSWLALGIGMAVRRRYRATIATFVVLLVWIALPLWLSIEINNEPAAQAVAYASPLFLPLITESNDFEKLDPDHPWLPVVANFAAYGLVASAMRRVCLRKADRCLRC